MKKRSVPTALFIIILMNSVWQLHAQYISVDPIPLINRLPSISVQRIFQDKEGFMWFGTVDGLCRYDAYNMLVFRSGMKNPTLLTNNEITSIAEDNQGRLIIGTKKGLNILDKETYQITPVAHEEISKQEIRTIMVDTEGYIWIGTFTWVYRFNSDFTLWKKFDKELPITSVNTIYQDEESNIWVSLWEQGLYKYNAGEDTFVKQPRVGEQDNPFKFFRDDKGRYWLCTWGDGVYLFRPDKEGEKMYKQIDVSLPGKPLNDERFFSISQDGHYGYIWLMSTSGICAIACDEAANVTVVDVSYAFKDLNNIFSEIVKDEAGNLWIAAFGEGAFTVNLHKPYIQNYAIPSIKKQTGFSTNIKALYEDKEGDIWISQNRWGVGLFNPEKNSTVFFRDQPALKKLPGLDDVGCISGFSSLPEEVWIAPETVAIIYCMRKEKNNMMLTRQIDLKKVVTNPGYVRLFYEDLQQNIWIITTTGIFIKPVLEDTLTSIDFQLEGITSITEDGEGRIWLGTKSNGIYIIQLNTDLKVDDSQIINITSKQGLMCNNIVSMDTDTLGNVWMGSNEGYILKYQAKTNVFEDMSPQFNMLEEGIQNLMVDKTGHIWISTNKRVIEYNIKNGGLIDYSTNDGIIINSFSKNSCYDNKSGKLFYGGNKGISVFTPYKGLSEKPKSVKIVVSDVTINGNSVLLDDQNNRFKVESQSLALLPEDKNIEISFSSLNYNFPHKIKYAYKLEGIDDDWVYPENGRQFAFYNQLPKGKYTFHLRATDVNGLWSNQITRISLNKSPAFYETWWAYLFYTIACILFLYSLYMRARNRMRLRNELRIAQIEKEKSEELTQTKLRYFTNVSHDFLTPLTIIGCLIDDVEITYKQKIPEFEMIRSNITRLKRLLQQILDFRKVESGNMKLKISRGDIATFIKDVCLSNFGPLMRKKQINFSYESEQEHIPAYFDADKMDKIIFNLLSNAFKYTPADGEIKVELKQYSKNNRAYVSVIISDTGVGIAKEDLNNIFTRFYTNNRGSGSETNGIGLSLTKELLVLHHGTIQVESELHKGTRFRIEVPIDRKSYHKLELNTPDQVIIYDKNIDLMTLEAPEYVSDNEKVSEEDIRILLVEDNSELLYLMYHILSKRYHVTIAKNGLEAFELMAKSDIDIVISDVMMPEMDGLELCRKLKSNIESSHIPVILLTARNRTEDRIECYNAGADGYISKPFELKVLEARISNFITGKKSKQEEFKTDTEIDISTLETSSLDAEFLDRIIVIIKENLSNTDFDVNMLSQTIFVSKSSLYRKIKGMTGLSPIEFIKNIRLKHASQLLKNKTLSIADVAYACGFSNPKYFATCFKEEFNMKPSEYQNSIK